MTDPNEAPEPAESAPDAPLDETVPPMDDSFAVDLSPTEEVGDE